MVHVRSAQILLLGASRYIVEVVCPAPRLKGHANRFKCSAQEHGRVPRRTHHTCISHSAMRPCHTQAV